MRFSHLIACLTLAMPVGTALAGVADSTDFDDLSRRAEAAVDSNPQQAIELFKQCLASHPDWADGWLYMGASQFKLGRYAEARQSLGRGAELQPGRGTPVAFLGMAEYELGDYRPALQHMLRGESIGLADNNAFIASVHYRAAMAFLASSDFAAAMRQLRPLAFAAIADENVFEAFGLTALRRSPPPGTPDPGELAFLRAAGRAAWAYEGRQIPEAGARLTDLAASYPSEPGIHYLYAVYLMSRDPEAAEKEFQREIAISPGRADARAQLATMFLHQGDVPASLTQAREAVRLQPSDAWCQATLGRALLTAGDLDGAIQSLERSVELAPNTSTTRFYLLQAYQRAGRRADAARQTQEWKRLRANELNGGNSEAGAASPNP